MNQKLDIELLEETIQLIDQLAEVNSVDDRLQKRSHLIEAAVRLYAAETRRAQLRQRLQEGAIRRAERDLSLTEEWFDMDEEVWQQQ